MPAVSSQQVRTKKRKDEKRRKGRSGGFILPGRGEVAKALPGGGLWSRCALVLPLAKLHDSIHYGLRFSLGRVLDFFFFFLLLILLPGSSLGIIPSYRSTTSDLRLDDPGRDFGAQTVAPSLDQLKGSDRPEISGTGMRQAVPT